MQATVTRPPRVVTNDPPSSLILRKRGGFVSHGGDAPFNRFDLNGNHAFYDTILEWILQGASLN